MFIPRMAGTLLGLFGGLALLLAMVGLYVRGRAQRGASHTRDRRRAGGVLGSQLTGVSSSDPYSYGASVAILLTVTTAACVVPARRACALDPIRALRRE